MDTDKRELLRTLLKERIRLEESPYAKLWQADQILEDDIDPGRVPTRRSSAHAVLVTGVTGYTGAFVLAEMCRIRPDKVYCLVRAEDNDAAMQRIKENLQSYLLWNEAYRDKIVPVLGDLAKPRLGLTAAMWDELAETLDAIMHVGFSTNFLFFYGDVRDTNVLGTKELLRLATTRTLKTLHYVSSFAVFLSPIYRQLEVYEHELPESPANKGGYAESKWIAEILMHEAKARGMPTTVIRPPFVGWHSETGVFNGNDFMCRLIAGSVHMRSAPDVQCKFFVLPADFVSRILNSILDDSEAIGKTFHIIANGYPWHQLVELISQAGRPIEVLPYEQWRYAVRMSDNNNPMRAFLEVLPPRLPSGERTYIEILDGREMPAVFNSANTVGLLNRTHQAYPVLDAAALQPLFRRMQAIGMI